MLHSKSEAGVNSNFHKHIKNVHQMTGKSYKVWVENNSNKSPAAASSAARGSSRQPPNASPPLEKVKNRPAGDSPDGPNGGGFGQLATGDDQLVSQPSGGPPEASGGGRGGGDERAEDEGQWSGGFDDGGFDDDDNDDGQRSSDESSDGDLLSLSQWFKNKSVRDVLVLCAELWNAGRQRARASSDVKTRLTALYAVSHAVERLSRAGELPQRLRVPENVADLQRRTPRELLMALEDLDEVSRWPERLSKAKSIGQATKALELLNRIIAWAL